MDNHLPAVIAGTYQVIGQIGSGGGGVVYLAEHLRLNKKVVLKADKRSLSTKQEALRREVDALKDLSHTNIPQVYDFIAEDSTVYTVMDFIDGESFDKPLKRGERFVQANIVEWACQLLDALDYLHSRPPHGILHADIKPSNVMLTPQGDVRLIDFNIALALGEEGAVAVGRSFGYASPEHYGLDYAQANVTQGVHTDVVTDLSDKTASDVETVLESNPDLGSGGHSSSRRKIMLDVRSDIYSLGATLYHVITGIRPAQEASKVAPISPDEYSPALIAIIEKAMNPNPALRYQSAAEMRYDFEHLRDSDPRTVRWRRIRNLTGVALALMLCIGALTTFIGLRQAEREQRAEASRQELYVLAAKSAEALRTGDRQTAIDCALMALPDAVPPIAEAQKALTDALRVYDLTDAYKHHLTLELPAAPLYLRISPGGQTAAAVYAYEAAIFDTSSGEILHRLAVEPSALAEVAYLSEDAIVYAGEGGVRAYGLATGAELWAGRPGTILSVSADGTAVAAIYKNEPFATVYDAASGQVLHEVAFEGRHQRVAANDSFANPNDNLLSLNKDASMLGVSFSDGSLWVYNLQNSAGDLELLDSASGFTHFEGGFNGRFFAFCASNRDNSIFAVVDTVAQKQTGSFASTFRYRVSADEGGICLQTENILVKVDPVTGAQTPLVTVFDEITGFAHSGTHTLIGLQEEYLFFDEYANLMTRHKKEYGSEMLQIANRVALIASLDAPVIRIMRLETHPEAEVFSYDPIYRHDEARLNANRTTVMLFSYKEFVLYDIGGRLIANVFIPDAGQVYDQQYRRDQLGSRLEVIYNSGTIRAYSADDGSLLYETAGEAPDLSLDEEFFTDELRIEAPLHGAPVAYHRETGALVRELERDAYLTYVTQVGEFIITEYISAEGERYGLLLNADCETLAELPHLCDIIDDTLIFDYPSGLLRECRVISIDELITLGKNKGGH